MALPLPTPSQLEFQFLLACIRHYPWVARNAWHFEDRRPGPERLLEQIIACFKYNSQIQFQSRDLTFYTEQWLADGILRFQSIVYRVPLRIEWSPAVVVLLVFMGLSCPV